MLIEIVALIMVFTRFMDSYDYFLASNSGIIRLLVPGAIEFRQQYIYITGATS
jgi:hypothetical protein